MRSLQQLFRGGGGGKLFAPRPATEAGRRLYAAAVVQARQPWFYAEAGVPDTYEGRFELYTIHTVLVLHRLKRQGLQAAETGQALFDAYLRDLDDALREMGVGDLSVGKKMRKLGEAFYGRAKAYDQVLSEPVDRERLSELIGRTVLAGRRTETAGLLAAYVARAVQALADQPLDGILGAELSWPALEETTR